MTETLVYDAARDGATAFTVSNIAMACIIAGFALMSVPIIQMIRRQPEKRTRGFIGLGTMALLAAVVVFGFRTLDTVTASNVAPEMIEGTIGSVTPKLITVGLMKVTVSCSGATTCPGIVVGDHARVAYIDDSGPETDALATKIWKQTR